MEAACEVEVEVTDHDCEHVVRLAQSIQPALLAAWSRLSKATINNKDFSLRGELAGKPSELDLSDSS